jgi:O-acetyl-ADP-ribose deacetylase (regulator of RNase III)
MINLTYVKGDAVKALQNKHVDFLMHCCNAQGVMGAGIAAQIRNAFPSTYQVYQRYCEVSGRGKWLLGKTVIESGVINAIAQFQTGTHKRQVHYGALAKCIFDLSESNEVRGAGLHMRQTRIAVPYLMGCGLAGGDWSVVKEILQSCPNYIDLIVYQLE